MRASDRSKSRFCHKRTEDNKLATRTLLDGSVALIRTAVPAFDSLRTPAKCSLDRRERGATGCGSAKHDSLEGVAHDPQGLPAKLKCLFVIDEPMTDDENRHRPNGLGRRHVRNAAGWSAVLGRVWQRSSENRLATAASSVAFYVLLGSIPCLAAVVWLYGLFADPSSVGRLSGLMAGIVPLDIAHLLGRQIDRLAERESASTKSFMATVGWLAFIMWSANQGMRGLVDALNIVYGRREERPPWLRLLLTILMTLGVVVFLVLAVFAILLLAVIVEVFPVDNDIGRALGLLRWPAMLLLAGLAIALLLRIGPSRRDAYWPSILAGSAVGALLWLGVSIVFGWYARNIASFSALYGSLGSVAAFMTWLWLSALTVLIGAEFDAAQSLLRSKNGLARQKPQDQENNEDDYRNEKQPFGDGRGPGGNVREAKDAGDERYQEENQR